MGKTIIKVGCLDQRLVLVDNPTLASGGRNEDEVQFEFCPLWNGFTKTAVFYRTKDIVFHAQITDDKCIIPHEVLTDEGWMYFGVFGVSGDTTRTSEVIQYRIVKGSITDGTKPSDPTPDIYQQIMAQVSAVNNRLTALTQPEPYSLTDEVVELENFEGMPMDFSTSIKPIQAGDGSPAPDNVRAISARDYVGIHLHDKNMVSMADMKPLSNVDKVHVDHGDNTLRVYTSPASTYAGAGTPHFRVHKGVTYTLSAELVEWSGVYARVGLRSRAGGSFTNLVSIQFTGPGKKTAKFTAKATTEVYLAALTTWGTAAEASATFANIQLEVGDTATEYEPYRGKYHKMPLGQTVYGGTLDGATGKLTLDHVLVTLTGTESWSATTDGLQYITSDRTVIDNSLVSPSSSTTIYGVCSHAPTLDDGTLDSDIIRGFGKNADGSGYGLHVLNKNGFWPVTDKASWQSYLAAQYTAKKPVQICYKLHTPTVVQLTPQQIRAQEGRNVLHSDSGVLTVSGRKDMYWLIGDISKRLDTVEEVVATLSAAAVEA